MNKVVQFGENIEGYNIPVLNEREIRAAAGILFLFMLASLIQVIFVGDYLLVKYAIVVFLSDLMTRVFINPKYSPLLIIGRFIVSKQNPEYVGAPQKKFAWKIGIAISTLMFLHLIVLNSESEIVGLGCLICLAFLFFESAFGICLACKFYSWYYKEKTQYCPGEVCDISLEHEIQKISKVQILIIVGLIVYILLTIYIFNEYFSESPKNLWKKFEVMSHLYEKN